MCSFVQICKLYPLRWTNDWLQGSQRWDCCLWKDWMWALRMHGYLELTVKLWHIINVLANTTNCKGCSTIQLQTKLWTHFFCLLTCYHIYIWHTFGTYPLWESRFLNFIFLLIKKAEEAFRRLLTLLTPPLQTKKISISNGAPFGFSPSWKSAPR